MSGGAMKMCLEDIEKKLVGTLKKKGGKKVSFVKNACEFIAVTRPPTRIIRVGARS